MIDKLTMVTEKEGMLTLAMFLFTTGGALIKDHLVAGTITIGAGVAIIFIRGYFKTNGRWKFK